VTRSPGSGWLRQLVGIWLVLAAVTAQAHKSSDSYLQIDSTAAGTHVRWDIALRDLDVALDLDTDEDGKLTWGEVKAAWPVDRTGTGAPQRRRVCGADAGL